MSNHSHLMGRRPTNRRPQPYDRFTRSELWERLQAAESRATAARMLAQRAASMAHNAAQGAHGQARRALVEIRDARPGTRRRSLLVGWE